MPILTGKQQAWAGLIQEKIGPRVSGIGRKTGRKPNDSGSYERFFFSPDTPAPSGVRIA
jgi:hypothetical protein